MTDNNGREINFGCGIYMLLGMIAFALAGVSTGTVKIASAIENLAKEKSL